MWINDETRERYIRLMANHYRRTDTIAEIRKLVAEDPQKLEDFADYYENEGRQR